MRVSSVLVYQPFVSNRNRNLRVLRKMRRSPVFLCDSRTRMSSFGSVPCRDATGVVGSGTRRVVGFGRLSGRGASWPSQSFDPVYFRRRAMGHIQRFCWVSAGLTGVGGSRSARSCGRSLRRRSDLVSPEAQVGVP